MATCVVSGTIVDASENGIQNAVVKAKLLTPTFTGAGSTLVPSEVSTTTDLSGNFTLTLSQSQNFVVSIDYPPNSTDSSHRVNYTVVTPATGTASFSAIATLVST